MWEQRCLICAATSTQTVCQECQLDLPYWQLQTTPHCQRCLSQLTPTRRLCPTCHDQKLYFTQIKAAFSYSPPLYQLLYKLKYGGNLNYSHGLSFLFWQSLASQLTTLPDVIIPVPLHPQKHKSRGFNQVEELIRVMLQANPQLIRLKVQRIKATCSQLQLNPQQRIINVNNAFACPHPLTNLKVAIVDDVVTTMATVNELARICRLAGASKVEIWCLMRRGN